MLFHSPAFPYMYTGTPFFNSDSLRSLYIRSVACVMYPMRPITYCVVRIL